PAAVPAAEANVGGAGTSRHHLAQHGSQETGSASHAKMDPAAFALENFDVMGGWRDRYRAEGGDTPEPGIAKSDQQFAFHYALPVDAGGELPDGRKFRDIRELKQLLLANEK